MQYITLNNAQANILDKILYGINASDGLVADDYDFFADELPVKYEKQVYDFSNVTRNAQTEILNQIQNYYVKENYTTLIRGQLATTPCASLIEIIKGIDLQPDTRETVGLIESTVQQERGVTLFHASVENSSEGKQLYIIRWITPDADVTSVRIYDLPENTNKARSAIRETWVKTFGIQNKQYCASEETPKIEASDRRRRANVWKMKRDDIIGKARLDKVKAVRDSILNPYFEEIQDSKFERMTRAERREKLQSIFMGEHKATAVIRYFELLTLYGLVVYYEGNRVYGMWTDYGVKNIDIIYLSFGVSREVAIKFDEDLRIEFAPADERDLSVIASRHDSNYYGGGFQQYFNIYWFVSSESELDAMPADKRSVLMGRKHELSVAFREVDGKRNVEISGPSYSHNMGSHDMTCWLNAMTVAMKMGNSWKADPTAQ